MAADDGQIVGSTDESLNDRGQLRHIRRDPPRLTYPAWGYQN
jgi:hypothetical protein